MWEQAIEENEVNTLYIFITAHYVGTTTLSDIQANMTRGNIRLGKIAFS